MEETYPCGKEKEKVKDNVSNNRHPMDNYGNGKRAEISIFVGNLPFSITFCMTFGDISFVIFWMFSFSPLLEHFWDQSGSQFGAFSGLTFDTEHF